MLATSLLARSAVGERHIRRITSADLPSTSNSSGSVRNNINVVNNCTPGSTNGSCSAALAEEDKRKTKDKLPELPTDDPHGVLQRSTHEALQERIHADIVHHLATTDSYEGPYYQDGDAFDTESSPSAEGGRDTYRHHDVRTEASDFNSTLTTPRIGLFDDRFVRVSESIRQNLEELDEQNVVRSTAGPTTELGTRNIPPTADSKVALEYTNHVSIQYNDTSNPPRSFHRDLVVENGTHVDFSSAYIHTEEIGATTTAAPARVELPSNLTHGNATKEKDPTEAPEDQSAGGAQLVANIEQRDEIPAKQNKTSEYLKPTHNITDNTVPPGEQYSTTSSSQALSTLAPKTNKTRYSTRRIQMSGVPTSTPSGHFTTSEIPPTSSPSPTNRTRSRMISSMTYQTNASNSVEDSPTSIPLARNSEVPRKKQTTRYSWRRPSNTTTSEAPMVLIQVPTVQPSSSVSPQTGNLDQGTTQLTRTGSGRFASARIRQNSTDNIDQTTLSPTSGEVRSSTPKRLSNRVRPTKATSSSLEVKSTSRPTSRRGHIKFARTNQTTDSDMNNDLDIPPTAAAWALASLRGPADVTRVVRRPSTDNDTDTDATTTMVPVTDADLLLNEDEAKSNSTGSSITTQSVEEAFGFGMITTPKAFKESDAMKRSHLLALVSEYTDEIPSLVLPTPALASMQENKVFTVQVQAPTTTTEAVPTTTETADLVGTTEWNGEESGETTTQPRTTTSEPEVTTTTVPDMTTTLSSNIDTTTLSEVGTTEGDVEPLTSTVVPEAATTLANGVDSEEVDEIDVFVTTPQPRASTEAVAELDLGDDAQDEHEDGAETEAPPPTEPKLVVQADKSSPEITTTQQEVNTNQVETTTEFVPETTLAVDFTTDASTDLWTPPDVPSEDVTVHIRVTLYTSWEELCRQKEPFKEALALLISNGIDRHVSAHDVVLSNVGREQCEGAVTDDQQLIPVNLYVLDDKGLFDTKLNEEVYMLVSPGGYPTPLEMKQVELIYGPLPTTSEPSNAGVIAAITISCVGAVCLLLLAALLIVMRKRQKRFNYGQRCTPVSLDAYSLDSVSVYDSVRRKGGLRASKRSYGNPAFDDPGAPSHPMNFAGLANFSSDRAALEEEFAIVPQVSPKADELPEGAETKNRYSNVIPLPETRVQLSVIEGEPLSDYINANYVRGPKNESKFYIACQAPLHSTVTDFWRMVWEQQSKVVLMLTDLVENGVEKCADYLPPSEVLDCHRLFGDFQITLKKREERDKYVISTLQLKNLETNSWREVTHLWYLSWPHLGVPDEANSIIAFLIEARTYMRANTGPNIVHCSPGTGRTGAILACDICIREFEQTRMVDIPRCVYRLRRDRGGAVKTRDQYVFIYQVLNNYATKLTGGGGLDSI